MTVRTSPLFAFTVALMCTCFATPRAEAQDISGTWFRATSKLRLVESTSASAGFTDLSGDFTRRTIKKRFWIHVDAPATSGYAVSIFDDRDEGIVPYTLENSMLLNGSVVTNLHVLLPITEELGVAPEELLSLRMTLNGKLVVKVDKNGDVKKGTLMSLGASGSILRNSTSRYSVDARVKAVIVPEAAVPPVITAMAPRLTTDRASFLGDTGATAVSDPYPADTQPGTNFTSGNIRFSTPAPSSLSFTNWPADFPDDNDVELALNDIENLTISDFFFNYYAMGIDFDDASGGSTPSTFTIEAFNASTRVARFEVSLPNADIDFVGVSSATPIDKLVFVEMPEANENEFFGTVFGSTTPVIGQ